MTIRVPGSEKVPFSPINPWGRKPQVRRADGSLIDWKSPLREPLFQVHVVCREKGDLPIGPKWSKQAADQFCDATKIAIKSGQVTGWTNPTVLPAL